MKIFFINLDSRKDRRDFFLNQFHYSNLDPIRISAIPSDETKLNVAPPEVSACWNSHQKAYEYFLKLNDNHALIFEDDAIVNSNLIKILENINETELDSIDLFQLGYLKDRNNLTVDSGKIDFLYRWKLFLSTSFRDVISRYETLKSKNLPSFYDLNQKWHVSTELKNRMGISEPFVYDSFEAGAHCYIISRKLAQKLINFNVDPVIISADLLLIEVANSKNFNCLRVSKSLSFQSSKLGSNINLRSQLTISNITESTK